MMTLTIIDAVIGGSLRHRVVTAAPSGNGGTEW
jgi:hypothetical protein